MSYCLSGTTGGAAYGLEFEFEFVKSPSSTSTTRTSHTTTTTSSSSPSSTISESSNSPLAISTRKPRTPRKRPNQTYNEAAALLSTVYPNIFSTKHLMKPYKSYTKPNTCSRDYDASSDFLLFYPPVQEKPSFRLEPKVVPGEVESKPVQVFNEFWEEGGIDTESILDDEVQEEGVIDSIMGNVNFVDEIDKEKHHHHHPFCNNNTDHQVNPIGLGFGMTRGVSALRRVDDGNWWCFPIVDVREISPRLTTNNNNNQNNINGSNSCEKKKKEKKTKKKDEKQLISTQEVKKTENLNSEEEKTKSELLLKLNYDDILNAWSDRASPFPDDISGSDSSQADIHARLAQIDLFSENGGLREASVMRYKEKRRTRLFSKKIRYQVRKVNADRRPRMKGRFVRRTSSKETAREKKGLGKK